MAPVGGNMNTAQKQKFVTHITGLNAAVDAGGVATNVAQDNLFKQRDIAMPAVPEIQPDGRWLLAGVRSANKKEYDRAVLVRFKTGK